jgi:hypothetical protein
MVRENIGEQFVGFFPGVVLFIRSIHKDPTLMLLIVLTVNVS